MDVGCAVVAEWCAFAEAVGGRPVDAAARNRGADGRRSGLRTTVRDPKRPSAPDLVDRAFARAEPNRLWVCDLNYIQTGQGFLFLDALGMAVTARGGDAAGVVAHSHHGSQIHQLGLRRLRKAIRHRPLDGLDRRPLGQRTRREARSTGLSRRSPNPRPAGCTTRRAMSSSSSPAARTRRGAVPDPPPPPGHASRSTAATTGDACRSGVVPGIGGGVRLPHPGRTARSRAAITAATAASRSQRTVKEESTIGAPRRAWFAPSGHTRHR